MANALLQAVIADIVQAANLREPIVEFGSRQVEDEQPESNDLRPLFSGR